MIYIRMTNGNIQDKVETPSETQMLGFGKSGIIDVSATTEAHRIAKLCADAGHFIETGVSEATNSERKYGENYWWLIKNCGDNCIKIFPKEGTRFGSLPRFSLIGEYIEDSDRV